MKDYGKSGFQNIYIFKTDLRLRCQYPQLPDGSVEWDMFHAEGAFAQFLIKHCLHRSYNNFNI